MLNNARSWAPRGPWRYAVALVAALAALGAGELMQPVLEAHMPALFYDCGRPGRIFLGYRSSDTCSDYRGASRGLFFRSAVCKL